MAIIAVLAVLIIGAITVARNTATETQNRNNARTIQASLEGYFAQNRAYPNYYSGSFTGFINFTDSGGTKPFSNIQFSGGSCPSSTSPQIDGWNRDIQGGGDVHVSNTAFSDSSGRSVNYIIYVANAACNGETSSNDRIEGP